MSNADLQIAMSLKGLDQEHGHVRLDDFLSQLAALKNALVCVDREINQKPVLYYRVVNMTHSSPVTITLEPMVKPKYHQGKNQGKFHHVPAMVHHRFFDELAAVRKNNTLPQGLSEQTFDAFNDLMESFGSGFDNGAIYNKTAKVELDVTLRDNLQNLTKPDFQSYGSVEGDLLGINLAHGQKFYIYPKVGPRSIACHFAKNQLGAAKRNLEQTVRVFGAKQFRLNRGVPFRIEVERIELVSPAGRISRLPLKRAVNRGDAADVLIAKDRDEW
jgi:hypothetical protein